MNWLFYRALFFSARFSYHGLTCIPLGTGHCCDVESTSTTLFQRRNNVLCLVGCYVIYKNNIFLAVSNMFWNFLHFGHYKFIAHTNVMVWIHFLSISKDVTSTLTHISQSIQSRLNPKRWYLILKSIQSYRFKTSRFHNYNQESIRSLLCVLRENKKEDGYHSMPVCGHSCDLVREGWISCYREDSVPGRSTYVHQSQRLNWWSHSGAKSCDP